MKRLAALLAAAAMMAAPATALALGPGDTQNIEVKAKYSGGTTTPAVYSVNIVWGAMEFTYGDSGSRMWQPDSHTYSTVPSAGWTERGNTVTVTNHSNRGVTVGFAYAKAAGYEDIGGTFSTASRVLAAGVENKPDEADSVTSTLTLSGTLDSGVTSFTRVGTITVSIK